MAKAELIHFRAHGNFLPLMQARDVAQFCNPEVEVVSRSTEIEEDGYAYMTLRDPNGAGELYLDFSKTGPNWRRTTPWEKK